MANHVIGAEIRLEGEKDFKRAVSSINTDLKVLGSELKKTESEYKGNENSLSALTAKSEQFTKIAEAQRKKVEILQTAVEKSRAKYTAAGENVEKYRKELSDAQGELERLKGSENATTQEVQEQEKAVAELAKKLATAEKGYATAEKQTKNWEVSLNRAEAELNDTERKLGETNKALREMGTSSRYTKGQIEAAESTLSEFGRKAQPIADGFKAAFKTVLAVSATAAGASAAVIKKSVDIGSDFESQMSKVKAISGATQSEMEQLTAKAKEMGGTTKFTAKQAGEALEYMSMAGWKTADMLGGIEGIMHLAAASGEDLGRTSDIVTDALTAFGMKASDAGHFADVLAAASSNANTNVGMMGETFKYVGAAAGALHYSAEDVGLSIGLMANAGIKASQAGTELNSIYTRLAVNTSGARDAIENLGIQFYTSGGKARTWGTILDQLRAKTVNMTDAEKTAFANRVAGQRAQAGLLAMLNATSADYDKLTKSINNADGAAKRIKNYKDLNKEITDYIASKQYEAKMSALDSEYKKYSVDKTKYHDRTKQARQAYEEQMAEFEKYSFNQKVDIDPSKLYDKQGQATDYYWEKRREVRASPGGTRLEDDFVKQADLIQKRADACEKAAKAEDKALKLINAVEQAYLLGNNGKYDEANKVLQNYFDDRDASFKRAENYENSQRKQAITELGNQLKEEVELHKTYIETGSKEMMAASVGYIRQAAEELKKVGIEIPDSIAEGLEAGTLTVDQAMAQIEQILRNGGKVDLMEEGKFSADTYIDGFETKENEAETAGKGLVNSTLAPLKSSKTEAGAAGVDAEKAFIGPIYRAVGEGEKAGKELADSTLSPLKSSKAEARKAGEDEGNGFIGPIYHAAGEGEKAGKKLAKSSLVPLKLAKSEAMEAGKSVGGAFGAGIPKGIDCKQAALTVYGVFG